MKRIIPSIVLLFGLVQLSFAQTGEWSGKIESHGMKIPLVFHLDDAKPTIDSPDQGVKGVPTQLERGEAGKITVKIPSIGATYEGVYADNQIVGTFKQWGTPFPLTLTPGVEKLNRPQTPKAPFPYATEEVSFQNGDAVLKGTLALPEGYSSKTPVLIMVTGSGLQNRDEELFEHKPFAVIADALARVGIATLRYDDRGFGESKGDIQNCTTEDLKNDALAGIKLLRERFEKVGVIGHSEGGTIALMLAAEKQADFIITLAGNVVSGGETLVWQNRLSLEAAGVPAETVETYCNLLAEAFDAIVAGKAVPAAGNKLPANLAQNYAMVTYQAQTPYLKYFIAMDTRPLLKSVTCPVLAFNGTKDRQVAYDANLEELKTGLPLNPKNRIVTVEGVNHMFQHCSTGEVSEYREIEETFSEDVLEIMKKWLATL